MRPVLCYGEVLPFFKMVQSFDQITTLTYDLMDNFSPYFVRLLILCLLSLSPKSKLKTGFANSFFFPSPPPSQEGRERRKEKPVFRTFIVIKESHKFHNSYVIDYFWFRFNLNKLRICMKTKDIYNTQLLYHDWLRTLN